jgi:hypothetical protein
MTNGRASGAAQDVNAEPLLIRKLKDAEIGAIEPTTK